MHSLATKLTIDSSIDAHLQMHAGSGAGCKPFLASVALIKRLLETLRVYDWKRILGLQPVQAVSHTISHPASPSKTHRLN
jgi:hypothetical protein